MNWGDDIRLPQSGPEYLHTVEAVHIHLFLGVSLYFACIAVVVAVATRLLRRVVALNAEICKAYRDRSIKPGEDEKFLSGKSSEFARFFNLRLYFFASLDDLRGSWSYLDEHLKNITKSVLSAAKLNHSDLDKLKMVNLMRSWFPFDVYVVMNYRYVLDEMIEVKGTTWLTICILLVIQALVQRAVGDDHNFALEWLIICQVVLVGMLIFVFYLARSPSKALTKSSFAKEFLSHRIEEYLVKQVSEAEEYVQEMTPKVTGQIVHRFKPLEHLSRLLQICLFFTNYAFASTIANKNEWDKRPHVPIICCFALVITGIGNGIFLGYVLLGFSVLTSTGQYMQEGHVLTCQAIVQAYALTSPFHLRQTAENVEEFEEMADEYEEEFQEQKHNHGKHSGAKSGDANGEPDSFTSDVDAPAMTDSVAADALMALAKDVRSIRTRLNEVRIPSTPHDFGQPEALQPLFSQLPKIDNPELKKAILTISKDVLCIKARLNETETPFITGNTGNLAQSMASSSNLKDVTSREQSPRPADEFQVPEEADVEVSEMPVNPNAANGCLHTCSI